MGPEIMTNQTTHDPEKNKAIRGKDEEIGSMPGPAKKRNYTYEIRLKNHLDQHWVEWFDGWMITNLENGEVLLTCSTCDHASLHGVLDKIRDLNLDLISVKRTGLDQPGPEENSS